MAERLQKIIASAGLMSRRSAEIAIRDGRVSVNGQVAKLGDCAERTDRVTLDGKEVSAEEVKRYYMLHKPKGYVCSLHDEKGRPSVRDLLPANAGRVYPVGRLDLMSEGLLLLTNDGNFAFRCMHPSGNLFKTYRTTVSGEQLQFGINRLRESFLLDGVEVQAVDVRILKMSHIRAVLDITVSQGRNRQIRRMCEMANLHVDRLVRISEGNMKLDGLLAGEYRELTEEEIAFVMGDKGE